jgi:hypothetical protein
VQAGSPYFLAPPPPNRTANQARVYLVWLAAALVDSRLPFAGGLLALGYVSIFSHLLTP